LGFPWLERLLFSTANFELLEPVWFQNGLSQVKSPKNSQFCRGKMRFFDTGGEGGIRTPGTGFGPYNGLANRRLQPLGHLSVFKPPKHNNLQRVW
jgi:hypothetical protein